MDLLVLQAIAKICHEANKAYCESIGDSSQKHWEDAEQWQRDSAISGVKFAIENPTASASAQHDAWLRDKLNAGWSYGEVKDMVGKTHPCCVPYESLPKEQRVKDALFKVIVVSVLPAHIHRL